MRLSCVLTCYADDVEDEDMPSGITIFADEEPKGEYEEGELPEKGDPVPPEKKMTVEFPGLNAPVPENADPRRWTTLTTPSSSFRNRSHHRPNRLLDSPREYNQQSDALPAIEYGAPSGYRSSDSHRGRYYDCQRDDRPPGTEQGPSLGSGYAAHRYSPRYGTYDHNNSLHTARSPTLERSFSDRGWQSPRPYSSGQESPVYSYHSPAASLDRWGQGSPVIATSDATGQPWAGNERQDHHHHQQRRHHRS